MVYTPRRRRLFRAIFVGLIFAGCVLLFERWNASGPSSVSSYVPRITKYAHNRSDTVYHERKNRKQAVNVTKILVINKKKQIKKSDVTKQPDVAWIKHPWTSSLRGFLNVHVWLDWCGSAVNDLRRNIHFPKYPDVRLKTKLFHLSHDAHNFGQRVFGFLHPPKTGHYTFAISSDDSSELWLSSDDDPKNARLIAWVGNLSDPFWQGVVGDGEFTKYESQISGKIFLRRNRRYFVEALHKQSTSNDHLLVAWKIPPVGNFSHITRGRISQNIHPHELHNLDVTRYARHIPLTPAVLQKPIILHKLKDQIPVDILNPGQNSYTPESTDALLYHRHSINNRDNGQFSRTEKKDHSDQVIKDSYVKQNLEDFIFDTKLRQSIAHKMYPSCDYNPSYKVDFKVARYEGIYLIHETAVYPDDKTHLKHVEYYKPCFEMRYTDSHGQMFPSAGQREFDGNEGDDNEDNREVESDNTMSKEHVKKHDNDQTMKTPGNIATVNYQDHRLGSVHKSNFSSGKRFNKRKILAILKSSNKNPNNSRYKRKPGGTTVTPHLAVTSTRFHDKTKYGGNLKKSANISERNSDDSMVKKSAKTPRYDAKNVVEKPFNRVGRLSSARVNGGSERKISKSTKTLSDIQGKSRQSLEKPVKIISNAGIRSAPGRARNKTKHLVNDEVNKNVTDRKQQGLREIRTSEDSPTRTPERRQANALSGTKISEQNSVNETRIPNFTQESWENVETIKRRRTDRDQDDHHNPVRILGLKGSSLGIQDNSYSNGEEKRWHRKRRVNRGPENIFVDDTSPLAMTFRKLQESGQWEEIKEYAKKNGLLLTKKTWMYVTWKFLRYEKPKKPHGKLVEFVYKQNPSKCRTDGNILLNEKVAKSIVNKYMKDLRKRYGSDVYLRRIVNIEENHDILKGDRYLIELDLGMGDKNETIQVSDYVYLPLGAQSFCSPQHFVWRRNVTVHVIVPVKDQGKWVQHFINDMSELYETTQDLNVNVIIVDFNSVDMDIEQALKRSSLKRYQFLQVNGSFQRALGIQLGADIVENPDDIIFTCDLHLDIPNNMIDIIRKHCVQGKMAFSPMVLRLECGFTPALPFGEWETMGYGLFAIYKSDFDRIGGMNIDEFKTQWGGEDWEMVDRCLTKGMEIERLRVPKFYHYFHSKQGMWGTYGFEDNVSGSIGDTIIEDELVPVYDEDEDNAIGYSYNQPLMPEY